MARDWRTQKPYQVRGTDAERQGYQGAGLLTNFSRPFQPDQRAPWKSHLTDAVVNKKYPGTLQRKSWPSLRRGPARLMVLEKICC
jgi:hypothetical protein